MAALQKATVEKASNNIAVYLSEICDLLCCLDLAPSPADFIKVCISMRDVLTSCNGFMAGVEASHVGTQTLKSSEESKTSGPLKSEGWNAVKAKFYSSFATLCRSRLISTFFKGTPARIVSTMGNFSHNDERDLHINDLLRYCIAAPSESSSKMDVLNFDLLSCCIFFCLDIASLQFPSKVESMPKALALFFAHCGGNLFAFDTDSAVRSRKCRGLLKVVQGICAICEGDADHTLYTLSECVHLIESQFNNWFSMEPVVLDALLKTIYASIRRLSSKIGNHSNQPSLERMITEQCHLLNRVKSSLQLSSEKSLLEMAKVALASSTAIMSEWNLNTTEVNSLVYLAWESVCINAVSLQFESKHEWDKLSKNLCICAKMVVGRTESATMDSESSSAPTEHSTEHLDLVSALITAIGPTIRQIYTSCATMGNIHSRIAQTLCQLWRCHDNQVLRMVESLLQVIILREVRSLSDSEKSETILFIQRDIALYFGKKLSSKSALAPIILRHLLCQWHALVHEECLPYGKYQLQSSWMTSHYANATLETLPVSLGSVLYLDGNGELLRTLEKHLQRQCDGNPSNSILPQSAMIGALMIKFYALWCGEASSMSSTRSCLLPEVDRLLDEAAQLLMQYRNALRQSTSSISFSVSTAWNQKAAKRKFLNMVDTAVESVRSSLLQPYLDYYIVKAWVYLVASKVAWFVFEDFIEAELLAKKALSYANNRSVLPSPETQIVRVEVSVFAADIYENVGKSARAVETVCAAIEIARSHGFCRSIILLHALRLLLRVDSTRLQDVVGECFAATEVVHWAKSSLMHLMETYPSLREKIASAGWMNYLATSPTTAPGNAAYNVEHRDVDLIWQRSAMLYINNQMMEQRYCGLQSETEALQYSTQCTLSVARQLRRSVCLQRIASLSPSVESTTPSILGSSDDLHAFFVGASSSFLSLERSTLSSSVTGKTDTNVDERSGADIVQAMLNGDQQAQKQIETLVREVLLRDTKNNGQLHPETGTINRVCFLTLDVASDAVLGGAWTPDSVSVQAISGGVQVSALIERWHDLLDRHHQQLHGTKDASSAARMSERDKQRWWKQREDMDAGIASILSELQALLGPLIPLLTGSSSTDTCMDNADRSRRENQRQILCDDEDNDDDLLSAIPGDDDDEFDRLVSAVANEFHLRDSPDLISTADNDQNENCGASSNISHTDTNYEDMKVTDLKALLKDRGLPVAGKKAELVARLQQPQPSSSSLPVAPLKTPSKASSSIDSVSFAAAKTASKLGSFTTLPPPPSMSSTSLFPSTPAATTSKAKMQRAAPASTVATSRKTATCTTGTTTMKRKTTVLAPTSTVHTKSSRPEASTVSQQHQHTIILLDEIFQALPIESMPCLRRQSCSRVLGLPLLIDLLLRNKCRIASTTAKTTSSKSSKAETQQQLRSLSAAKTWYALDSENNLPSTRSALQPFFADCEQRWQWPGYVGSVPSEDVVR